ncbi:hypothetical protein NPIL_638091 [Nephila pilipes]|uniref:Uncharacterized protein n=1 Tax=Nephila pilipes TaxID=299642 RepID=A0A8X6TTB8_NEPPI|nr:hypothetical protein NPIL_638091 [Nephila pilipes]
MNRNTLAYVYLAYVSGVLNPWGVDFRIRDGGHDSRKTLPRTVKLCRTSHNCREYHHEGKPKLPMHAPRKNTRSSSSVLFEVGIGLRLLGIVCVKSKTQTLEQRKKILTF